jgi:hypothetical protein
MGLLSYLLLNESLSDSSGKVVRIMKLDKYNDVENPERELEST